VGLALDGWDVGAAFDHIFSQILDFGAQTGDELARALRGLVGEVGSDIEAFAARLGAAAQYLAGVRAFIEAPLEATRTLNISEALAESGRRLRELVAGFDGSLEAQQAILAATQSRYEAEIAYLNQIQALAAEISRTLAATAESIRTAFFTDQQRYDEAIARGNTALGGIGAAGSAEEVARLVALANEAASESWRLLLQASPESAQANQQAFLDFLAQTEAAAQDRLSQLESTMREDSAAIRTDLAAQIADLAAVGDRLAAAANSMAAAAASIPDRIVVESRVNVSIPELG
jgi:hypothetical protein